MYEENLSSGEAFAVAADQASPPAEQAGQQVQKQQQQQQQQQADRHGPGWLEHERIKGLQQQMMQQQM